MEKELSELSKRIIKEYKDSKKNNLQKILKNPQKRKSYKRIKVHIEVTPIIKISKSKRRFLKIIAKCRKFLNIKEKSIPEIIKF